MNYCDGCDTAKHCSNTPEHKRPCQNMERQDGHVKINRLLAFFRKFFGETK